MSDKVIRVYNTDINVAKVSAIADPYLNISGDIATFHVMFDSTEKWQPISKWLSAPIKQYELKTAESLKDFWIEYNNLLETWKKHI